MKGKKVDSLTDLILKAIPLTLVSDVVSSSPAGCLDIFSEAKAAWVNLVCLIRVGRGLAVSRLFLGILKIRNGL